MVFLLGFVTPEVSAQLLELRHVRTFQGHAHGVRKVAFSPDGVHFASGGTRGELFVWSLDGQQSSKQLEGHYGSITDLRYSPSGKYLITAGAEGQVKVWDAKTGSCLQRIIVRTDPDGNEGKVNFALLDENTLMVYFGGSDRKLYRVPFKSDNTPEVIYTEPKDPLQCAALDKARSEIVFAAGDYLMALDLNTGRLLREYNTGNCKVNALEFSSDGSRLLTWCSNSRVDVRNPANFYLITSFRSGTGGNEFSNLAFTEDGKHVVTGDHASRFNVWDLEKKQCVLDQGAEQGTILAFDLNGKDNSLLSASLDNTIKLWQIVPRQEQEQQKPRKKNVKTEETVVPDVEIVQYAEPVQDVPQRPLRTETTRPAEQDSVIQEPGTPSADIDVPFRSIVSELPERKENRRVKPIRKEHRLQFTGSQLQFDIWDAQVIDGDIVSIYVDNECIVKEYSITAVKKTVYFDASKYKKLYVYLHAHNLGTLPPNTVTMTVSDGITSHQVELRADLTGSAALEITFIDPSE